jgi:hypothetical protein
VTDTLASKGVLYPTPYMQQVFPMLQADIWQLRKLVAEHAQCPDGISIDRAHGDALDTLEELCEQNYPALGLFLAHPTKRLLPVVLNAATAAVAAVASLMQHPLRMASKTCRANYWACCIRLESGVHDWNLSVDLARASHNLEEAVPEALH